MTIRKKIEEILLDEYPHRGKRTLTEAVDKILEETQWHFEIENRKKWATGKFLRGIDFSESGSEDPIVKVMIYTDKVEMTRKDGQRIIWKYVDPMDLLIVDKEKVNK